MCLCVYILSNNIFLSNEYLAQSLAELVATPSCLHFISREKERLFRRLF